MLPRGSRGNTDKRAEIIILTAEVAEVIHILVYDCFSIQRDQYKGVIACFPEVAEVILIIELKINLK